MSLPEKGKNKILVEVEVKELILHLPSPPLKRYKNISRIILLSSISKIIA